MRLKLKREASAAVSDAADVGSLASTKHTAARLMAAIQLKYLLGTT